MTRFPRAFLPILLAAWAGLAAPVSAQDQPLGAENYRQADADGDGILVYAEFATFIDLAAADGLGNAERISARGWHSRAFSRVDADGDGRVTPQELEAMQ